VDFAEIIDAPTKIDYAINRYQTETKRLYQVLNDRLVSERKFHGVSASTPAYMVGNKYSIADICTFSWVNVSPVHSCLLATT
jgi:glutathione S-transferase